LDAIPAVDVTSHSVSLEDVVFDAFDGSFVRLSQASDALIRRLRDAIRPFYTPVYGDNQGLSWLRDDALVIGYVTSGSAYASPSRSSTPANSSTTSSTAFRYW
jgi:hypothetical protein